MDDNYKTSLIILKRLLEESQNEHWANWISKDITYWDEEKNTRHHLSAFGGMGSINDLYVANNNQIGIWKNRVFDMTKSLSWYFATNKTTIAPNKMDFYVHGNGEMHGWKCNNCKHTRLNASEIDSYLSFNHLPNIIYSLIKNNNLIDILPLEKWVNRDDIVDERKALRKILDDCNIDILDIDQWLNECPKCSSKSVMNNEWKFNKKLDLIDATKNLKISFGKSNTEKLGFLTKLKNWLK